MKTSKFNLSTGKIALAMILSFSLVAVSCSKEDNDIQPVEPQSELVDIATILENSEQYPELFSEQDDLLKRGGKSKYVAKRPPTFFNLTMALVKTNLLSTVARNQLTVLAPSDEAFEELFKTLGVSSIRDLSAEQLRPILLYHVIQGKVFSSQLKEGFVPTLNGAAVEVNLDGGVMFNDANVVFANIRALNGVIHVIDKVLLPPTNNLVETAASVNDFSTLVEAVTAAGLAETLATGGPFTVFAPTNAAFMALLGELGFASLDALVAAIGLDGLTQVLLYHVVEGRIYSSDLPAGPLNVKTLNGQIFSIDASQIQITDARSRESNLVADLLNIQATNGVIHVIDKVLLPPSMNLVEKALSYNDPEFSILVQAVTAAGLGETLATGGPFTVFAPTNDAFVALLGELGFASLEALLDEKTGIGIAGLTEVLLYHVVDGRVYSSDLPAGPLSVNTLNGQNFTIDASKIQIIDAAGRDSYLVPGLLDIQATNGVIHVIDRVILPKL